jgi:hypothetical protein
MSQSGGNDLQQLIALILVLIAVFLMVFAGTGGI